MHSGDVSRCSYAIGVVYHTRVLVYVNVCRPRHSGRASLYGRINSKVVVKVVVLLKVWFKVNFQGFFEYKQKIPIYGVKNACDQEYLNL